MSVAVKSLGVQSWCFRAFPGNADVAAKIKTLGLHTVELCDLHAKFGEPDAFDDVVTAYHDAGIEIVSVGVNTLTGDRVRERNLFEFVRRAGARFMSVSFTPETLDHALPTAQGLADQYDIGLAIHNHGGRDWLGSARVLEYVFARSTSRIGLCLDTAWALDSGEDPVEMVRRFGKRLYGLHIKDFVFDRAGRPTDVVVGSGNLNLPGLKKALDEVAFDGYAVVEYEGDVDNPMPALTECVTAVRTMWG